MSIHTFSPLLMCLRNEAYLLGLFVEGKKGVIMSWAELRRSFFCSAIGSQPPSLHPIHTHMFLALLWDTLAAFSGETILLKYQNHPTST